MKEKEEHTTNKAGMMQHYMCVALCTGAAVSCLAITTTGVPYRIALPPQGSLYHSVYPGGATGPEYGEEDDITSNVIAEYELAVGQRAAWVYFSHNWYRDRQFPQATAEMIREMGAVPFVRLMLMPYETKLYKSRKNPFRLQAIIDGTLDNDLKAWARSAVAFGTPLLVEYGTEVNGAWFAWNGKWHGAGRRTRFGDARKPDGPERFIAAFRRIVTLMRAEGASNITWVFHVNNSDWPDKAWNRFENYYPGDDVVDWIGVSAYSAQTPMERSAESLRGMMDACYPRLVAMAPAKPIMLLEFGCTAGPYVDAAQWAGAALADILGGRWPKLAGFSWWNERWQNDNNHAHDTTMRVQDVPELAEMFRTNLAASVDKLQTRPIYQ